MVTMKELYFDESGSTGNNLLDSNQPYFVYLGVHSDKNIENKFLELKQKYNYSNTEVKGYKICRSPNGKLLVGELSNIVKGRVKYNVYNKTYSLAGKIFEYVYEPIYSDCSDIFYSIDFHVFFSSLIYKLFNSKDETAETLLKGFKEYIVNKKQDDFLVLLGDRPYAGHPLYYFYQFCALHRSEIAKDVTFSTPVDCWLLELTGTALYSLVGSFAEKDSEELCVICDESKPLNAIIDYVNRVLLNDERFHLKEEVKLCDSHNNISLQISDILVSSISYAINHKDIDFSKKLLASLPPNCVVCPTNTYSEHESKIYNEIMKELCKKENSVDRVNQLGFSIRRH
jgi:hypothetical protein